VEDCRRAVGLIVGGVVDVSWMVSHRYGLKDFAQAIAAAQDPAALKVVVQPERSD
jgi:threonine dehydrogenase-like Zn-dependent dehydrogenase